MSSVDASVDRLTVEAGKYLGLTAGDEIEKNEIREQAKAEGYVKGNDDSLDSKGKELIEPLPEKVEIPEQGDLFGEVWPGNQSCGTLCADSRTPTLDKFADYRSDKTYQWKGVDSYNHTFNKKTALKRFVLDKNVGRYFNKEYDTYSTVMITYCADKSEKDIAQHAQSFYPRAVVRKRRQILKELDVYDSYAGVAVLAPKYRSEGLRTHAHSIIRVPGTVSPDDFQPLILKHVEKVDGATAEQHPDSAITVRHWDNGTHYCEPLPQGPDDIKKGATSSLPYELGKNLPWLKHPNAEYVKEWSAGMWQSEDRNTVARWKPMGKPSRYKEIADRMDSYTKLREGAFAANAIRGTVCPNCSKEEPVQPESSLQLIPKPAQDALIRAVAQFAQMPSLDPMEVS